MAARGATEALSGLFRSARTEETGVAPVEATPIGAISSGETGMGTPRTAGKATANTTVAGTEGGPGGPFQKTTNLRGVLIGTRHPGTTGWHNCRHLEILGATGEIRGPNGAKTWSAPTGGNL
jgi:hypothetical protein